MSQWPLKIARTSAALATIGGTIVLLGWIFDIAALKSVLPIWRKMSPLTAMNFVLVGVALWCVAAAAAKSSGRSADTFARVTGKLLANALTSVVVLTCAVKLGAVLLQRDIGIDLLLFHEAPDEPAPATMAPTTALNFLAIGCALLLARTTQFIRLFQAFALSGFLVGWLGFSQYLFGGEPLLPFVSMAAHTAALFLILSIGVLCVRTDAGLMALLVSDSSAGLFTRRLIPPALLIPLTFAWLRLEGQRLGWYGTEAGISLYAISNVIVFGTLVWINAVLLNRSEAERRRSEDSRRATEAQLQTVVENMTEGLAVSDLEGQLLHFNRTAVAMHGFRNLEDALHRLPEYAEIFELSSVDGTVLPIEQWPLAIVLRGEPLQDLEIRIRRLHTEWERIFSYGGTLVRNADGTPTLAVVTINDITERKQAELKLQAQFGQLKLLNQITRATGERQDLNSIFQVVVRSIEDELPVEFACVCLLDPVDHVLTVSSVGIRSEALAMELAMMEKARIPIDANGLSRCVRGTLVYEPDIGASGFAFPRRLAAAGLSSLVAAPLRVESDVFGVLIAARRRPRAFSSDECEFLRQLSEQVALSAHQAQLHTALQQAYDDLRQTQQVVMQQERLRALGQMASGIAHDINNAISPVILYTESLLEREPNLSPRAREYLETIRHAINDVAATVARMREFYRQREPQLTLVPVQLDKLARQVTEFTRARWSDMPQQRGIMIGLHMDFAPELPTVLGVESEIREALTNLIFNAVDAMPEGGTITLATRAMAPGTNQVCVEVADTGAGMDEETQRRCLEPFFTTKGERGTGLGLPMVYGMAQRHGAEIEIESSPGLGTKMRLVFSVPSTPNTGVAAPSTATRPTGRLRILLVDDDPLLLKSLRDTLESDSHVVTVANGGQAGIDAFRAALKHNEAFAVVITDLGMPYVDGRQVAAAIKAASPVTPVLMLTGWGQRLADDGDIPPHVDRLLAKPPKLSELRAALAACTSPVAN